MKSYKQLRLLKEKESVFPRYESLTAYPIPNVQPYKYRNASSTKWTKWLYLYFFFILCVVFYLHLCLCTMNMPDAFGGWKMMLDPLELELLIIVKYLYIV